MRALFLSLAIIVSMCTSASASEFGFSTVISSQIQAFKDGDVEAAFSFASPEVQSNFGTAENFVAMVQSTYPMIWRPADFMFLGQKTHDVFAMQEVIFFDSYGKGFTFIYEMIDLAGSWKINGVFQVNKEAFAV